MNVAADLDWGIMFFASRCVYGFVRTGGTEEPECAAVSKILPFVSMAVAPPTESQSASDAFQRPSRSKANRRNGVGQW